jgi:hypothetical protein
MNAIKSRAALCSFAAAPTLDTITMQLCAFAGNVPSSSRHVSAGFRSAEILQHGLERVGTENRDLCRLDQAGP